MYRVGNITTLLCASHQYMEASREEEEEEYGQYWHLILELINDWKWPSIQAVN